MTRALLLLSGGIDSPVAGRVLQEAGVELEAVHFSLEPFTDASGEAKATALAGHLGLKRLFVAAGGPPFGVLTKECDHRLYFVLSKRFMAAVASELARDLDCGFIATGENLGQVSSQTLPNLATIDAAARLPVLRPLTAFDKHEIVDLAVQYGTFDVSKGPEMCDVLGPKHPATVSTLAQAAAEEAKVDYDALVAACRLSVREAAVTAAVPA